MLKTHCHSHMSTLLRRVSGRLAPAIPLKSQLSRCFANNVKPCASALSCAKPCPKKPEVTTGNPPKTFYRRPLHPPSIAFASPEGKQIFREAMAMGGMEAFFPLVEQYHTQVEPAYCALGTLVTALNALSIDPGRRWKGVWRWFSEEMLTGCESPEVVKEKGLVFNQVACIARCNGADVVAQLAQQSTESEFRKQVVECTRNDDRALIVSYSRAHMKQTGDGHFSPIAGYHAGRDLCLILDVARFKYPSHWVPVSEMFKAMQRLDKVTGMSRGWMIMRRPVVQQPSLFVLSRRACDWQQTARFFTEELPARLPGCVASDPVATVAHILNALPPQIYSVVTTVGPEFGLTVSGPHKQQQDVLLAELRGSALFSTVSKAAQSAQEHVRSSVSTPLGLELVTMLLLSLPPKTWLKLPPQCSSRMQELSQQTLEQRGAHSLLANEVANLRSQMEAMLSVSCEGTAGSCTYKQKCGM